MLVFSILVYDFIDLTGLNDSLSRDEPTLETHVHVMSPWDLSLGYTTMDEPQRIMRKYMVRCPWVSPVTHTFFAWEQLRTNDSPAPRFSASGAMYWCNVWLGLLLSQPRAVEPLSQDTNAEPRERPHYPQKVGTNCRESAPKIIFESAPAHRKDISLSCA
jgi:hypothetical protein